MNLIILYWILVVVMLIGSVGAFVPALPGSSLILIAILIWGFAKGFAGLGLALTVAVVVLILSAGVGFVATYVGAKGAGASKWGQLGAVVGLILGFFGLLPALPVGGPLLGVVAGAVLGAFVGEFLYRKDLEMRERTWLAFKVSIAIVLGSLVGNLIEGLLAIAAVATFLISTWSQVSAF